MSVSEKCSFWEDSWHRNPLIDNNVTDKLIKGWDRKSSEYKIKANMDNQS